MPIENLTRILTLPSLSVTEVLKRKGAIVFVCRKNTDFEICPHCAVKVFSVHDHRVVRIRDAPIRRSESILEVHKRRFRCQQCRRVFLEPIEGVRKGHRTTERYKEFLREACEKYTDLQTAKNDFHCSSGFLYETFYSQLEKKLRMRMYDWPATIGIDEHSFKRVPPFGETEFVTVIVDHKNRRMFDLVEGRDVVLLNKALDHIGGREKVRLVTMDMSVGYRTFVQQFFPNARIVIDKFHVLRLFSKLVNEERLRITGDKRKHPMRKLLLKKSSRLHPSSRNKLSEWLLLYPTLSLFYRFKVSMERLYDLKGQGRHWPAFMKLVDRMALHKNSHTQKLRAVLISWRKEIMNYFQWRITNARVEGFNNKSKLIKRRAYGYKNFKNYRARIMVACS